MKRVTRKNPLATVADINLAIGAELQVTFENIVGNYEQETLDLIDRMTVRPDYDHREAIDTLIAALKTGGVWAKLDGLYLLAAHTEQAALLNWVADARNLTAFNSPVFTADRGIAGDGVSSYLGLSSSFSGATLPNLSAGDESLGIWIRTNVASDTQYSLSIGTSSTGTVSNRRINPRTASTAIAWAINTSIQGTGAHAAGANQFIGLSRNAADAYEYLNGGLEDSVTEALVDDPAALSLYVTIGRFGATYSTREHSAVFYGGYLTAVEQAVLYNALNDYMTALGAN